MPSSEAAEDQALKTALGLNAAGRVWIAGSTHEGEEELLLEVYKRLIVEAPDLRLAIARPCGTSIVRRAWCR